jgi:hypothetical protein
VFASTGKWTARRSFVVPEFRVFHEAVAGEFAAARRRTRRALKGLRIQ